MHVVAIFFRTVQVLPLIDQHKRNALLCVVMDDGARKLNYSHSFSFLTIAVFGRFDLSDLFLVSGH
jgi:hypothetical protein